MTAVVRFKEETFLEGAAPKKVNTTEDLGDRERRIRGQKSLREADTQLQLQQVP